MDWTQFLVSVGLREINENEGNFFSTKHEIVQCISNAGFVSRPAAAAAAAVVSETSGQLGNGSIFQPQVMDEGIQFVCHRYLCTTENNA